MKYSEAMDCVCSAYWVFRHFLLFLVKNQLPAPITPCIHSKRKKNKREKEKKKPQPKAIQAEFLLLT